MMNPYVRQQMKLMSPTKPTYHITFRVQQYLNKFRHLINLAYLNLLSTTRELDIVI